MRKYHKDNLARILEGRRCEACGATDNLCFTDYNSPFKDGRKRIEGINKKWLFVLNNATCLCRSCFMRYNLTDEKTPVPMCHGTYKMYKVGKCRCEECRAANAARIREERRRRRER